MQSELEEKRGEADALRRIGEATGSAFDQEAMLKVTAEIASQITGTDSCQIYLFDSTKEELTLRAADESFASMAGKIRLKLGEGITGWVAKERKPVAVSKNAYKDHRFKFFPRNERGRIRIHAVGSAGDAGRYSRRDQCADAPPARIHQKSSAVCCPASPIRSRASSSGRGDFGNWSGRPVNSRRFRKCRRRLPRICILTNCCIFSSR